ncbi:MAG: DUF58 domain-containing protein [bacterium]|nr:DUF58 domain-containing protein [bacterium]
MIVAADPDLERAAAVARGLALDLGGPMGLRPGERRFPGRPQPLGLEIESHAPYAPGDDLRHLDWSALGRLDSLLVRRFTAEREVDAHLLVDASASMALDGKPAAVRALALALAALALRGGYAVRVATLGAGAASAAYRRPSSLPRVARRLDAGGGTGGAPDLGAALDRHAQRHPAGGVALVLSDLLADPATLAPGLRALAARGFVVVLFQVLGPHEIEPGAGLAGARLRCAETGDEYATAPGDETLARYRAALAAHESALDALATPLGARRVRVPADGAVEALVTGPLRALGIVRPR